MDHDSFLIHDLTGGVGEGRQRQGDSLHLPLTHFLLMLLFQVLPPGEKRGTRSGCASCRLGSLDRIARPRQGRS